ncbi:hypothetical protein F8388_018192 [Cannabis sativa]|uniref:Reverse transcriptase zinc-binding domain-containing protein n=1 Tax=Cannabis sativa TaxID=3483 RepID=A0A7J6GB89_CANSA|nr:hypothetical protein F8388_018192 [Cannabis sativa]
MEPSIIIIGHAPSYVWWSIIWGMSLLIKGLRKRVGTDNLNLLVRDLIDESRSGWNMQMVRKLFNVADQQSICSLPISKFPKADSWMWHYSVNGNYSMKSGYYVESQLAQFHPSPSKSWFTFWKTSLPKKVLIFAWRGFHDALPMYVGLQKRKVVDHTNFPICGFSVDSTSHVVFLCRGLKKIWKELRVTLLNNLSMDISFKQIVLKASEILSRSDYELFLVAAWYIQGQRNQIVHGRKANPSDVVVSQIFNYEVSKDGRLRLLHSACVQQRLDEVLDIRFYNAPAKNIAALSPLFSPQLHQRSTLSAYQPHFAAHLPLPTPLVHCEADTGASPMPESDCPGHSHSQ